MQNQAMKKPPYSLVPESPPSIFALLVHVGHWDCGLY